MATSTQPIALSAAQISIYSLLSILVLYILIRHRKLGFLGWLYLFAFTSLRIIGNGLFLSDTSSSGAIIIISVGISPLLLAAFGILSEARTYLLNPPLKQALPLALLIHVQVATGVALVASGSSSLTSSNPSANSENIIKIGISILLTAWLLICIISVISFFQTRSQAFESPHGARDGASTTTCRDGRRILISTLFALPLLGIRVLYSVIADFTQSTTLNPVSGSVAVRVVLSIVPEMLVTIVFIVGGLVTRNIAKGA